jgi:hypothetical protein
MRRMALVCLAGLVVVGLAVCAAPASLAAARHGDRRARNPVTVQPSIGWPATWFEISFHARDRTGTVHGDQRYYEISATGPQGGGCADGSALSAQATHAGVVVHVTLSPGRRGWCVGAFRGTVTEQERPVCRFREACPMYVVLLKTIGSFTFHVHARPPGGDTKPPVFAGLQSASQCFGGAARPGETHSVGLAWKAASDDVTPSSEIRYDIYMAARPGREDFSEPDWTTRGKTSFTTPSLPAGRYFVVRARDGAGNEDRNTVEHQAENPCL